MKTGCHKVDERTGVKEKRSVFVHGSDDYVEHDSGFVEIQAVYQSCFVESDTSRACSRSDLGITIRPAESMVVLSRIFRLRWIA